MQSERRGMFVTLEGPDGSGKSMQSVRLGANLEAAGIGVVVTREPGGTAVGDRIREILLNALELRPTAAADALLFSAARAQHAAEVIEPALARGEVVVCDRFLDSTLAYQGYGSGKPLADLRALGRFAVGDLRPDLTLLLDLPPEEGLRRKLPQDEVTRFEASKDLAYHRRVREGFLALAAAEPERFVIVDATRDPARVEADILAAVLPRVLEGTASRAGGLESGVPSEPGRAHARMDR